MTELVLCRDKTVAAEDNTSWTVWCPTMPTAAAGFRMIRNTLNQQLGPHTQKQKLCVGPNNVLPVKGRARSDYTQSRIVLQRYFPFTFLAMREATSSAWSD